MRILTTNYRVSAANTSYIPSKRTYSGSNRTSVRVANPILCLFLDGQGRSIEGRFIRTNTAGTNLSWVDVASGTADQVVIGEWIDLGGETAGGFTRIGEGLERSERAGQETAGVSYQQKPVFYRRGVTANISVADVSADVLGANWPHIADHIRRLPFVLEVGGDVGYCWCEKMPVPIMTRPGRFSITWNVRALGALV